MARKACQPIVNGNSALQDTFNLCLLSFVNSLKYANKNYQYFKVQTATYTISSTDYIIGVEYTDTGIVTLTLPEISNTGKQLLIITDEGGNANLNNITINASGSDTIGSNGDTDILLKKRNISIQLYNDGINKWFVFGGA